MPVPSERSGCRRRRSSRPAFTMVELVIVVLIIGIMAAVAVPQFADSVEMHRATAAATRVKLDLELARTRAKMTSADQDVEFDLDASSYSLPGVADLDRSAETYAVDLTKPPYDAALKDVDFSGSQTVQFNGFGIPDSAGSVTIQVGSHVRTVSLDSAGKATVQ